MAFAGTGLRKSKRGTPLLGRRCVFINDGQYSYNVRDEFIFGQNQTYAYDDIGVHAPTSVSEVGNRTTAEGKTYTANNLNQYTAIDDFAPQYDADGNQTLIKTETGIWSVVYNAENRPIRWQSGDTVITMSFDRIGRRVDYYETRAGQVATHFRFVYDNFLCIQRLNASNGNAVRTEFVWDPTEPIATRPLVMRAKNWDLNLFYTHDGNKNVSEVFYHALQNGIAAHYDYAPFGAVSRTSRATRVTNRDLLSENPFRFSSEYHDSILCLTYYNFRHYNPLQGGWLGRDPICELDGINLYQFLMNCGINCFDGLGLSTTNRVIPTYYLVSEADDFKVPGRGAMGYFEAKYFIDAEAKYSFRMVSDQTCDGGCRHFAENITISFKVVEDGLIMSLPKLDPAAKAYLSVEVIKRIEMLISAITTHEQSHYNDYIRWKTAVEASKVSAASQNACSKEELDNKIRTVMNAAQPPVKDLHDFYEETHKKLGRGIANLWEVINLGEEIKYVY